MTQFFVSYRRSSQANAERIQQALSSVLESADLTLYPNFPRGRDVRDLINTALSRALAALVVVDEAWKRELHLLRNPNDWVRIEIAGAMASGIPVIPLFVDTTPLLPTVAQMPDEIQGFCYLNGHRLTTDTPFEHNVADLAKHLQRIEQGHRWAATQLRGIQEAARRGEWAAALEITRNAYADAQTSMERQNNRVYPALCKAETLLVRVVDAVEAFESGCFTQAREILADARQDSRVCRTAHDLAEIAIEVARAASDRDQAAIGAQRARLRSTLAGVRHAIPGQEAVARFVSRSASILEELTRLEQEAGAAYDTARLVAPPPLPDGAGNAAPDILGSAYTFDEHSPASRKVWTFDLSSSPLAGPSTTDIGKQLLGRLHHEKLAPRYDLAFSGHGGVKDPALGETFSSNDIVKKAIERMVVDLDHSSDERPGQRREIVDFNRLQFTVMANKELRPNTSCVVEIWAHALGEQSKIIALSKKRHVETSACSDGTSVPGPTLAIRLKNPLLATPSRAQPFRWQGDALLASVPLTCPPDALPGMCSVIADLVLDDLKIGELRFSMGIDANLGSFDFIESSEFRATQAFASFDDRDWRRIEKRVEEFVRVSNLVNLDACDALRRHAGWSDSMQRLIPHMQYFFVFWSANARQSPLVHDELRVALAHRCVISGIRLDDEPIPDELQGVPFARWD
jgi:hypothetical protein